LLDHTSLGHWSFAAQLVGLSVQLRGDQNVLTDMETEAGLLDVPRVSRLEERVSWPPALLRFDVLGLVPWIDAETPDFYPMTGYPRWPSRSFFSDLDSMAMRLWTTIRNQPETQLATDATLALFYLALFHSAEIVRVCAAAAASAHVVNAGPLVEAVLVEGITDTSDTVRTIAANALCARNPDHPALRTLLEGDEPTGAPEPVHTSITIHGTWARFRGDWWKPGSDFYNYLTLNVSGDLYPGTDNFRWEGHLSENARQKGARDLQEWMSRQELPCVDTVYAHSHGGNVALDAALLGVRFKLLVLMSVPVRSRTADEWNRIRSCVGRMVSLRSHFDLVVLLDGSGQRFDGEVHDILSGTWFTHSAVHTQKVWERRKLPPEIQYERSLA
jgi:hypothetical protein